MESGSDAEMAVVWRLSAYLIGHEGGAGIMYEVTSGSA